MRTSGSLRHETAALVLLRIRESMKMPWKVIWSEIFTGKMTTAVVWLVRFALLLLLALVHGGLTDVIVFPVRVKV